MTIEKRVKKAQSNLTNEAAAAASYVIVLRKT